MGGESSTDNTLSPGDPLGPYTIVRAIGRGAAGAVYEASKRPLDKRIALKLLHAGAFANAHQFGRFQREARAAAALRHPNIVDVDDFGVAKLADPGAGNELTQTGDLVGTPNYMSPEQWKSARDATAQSDQWALAVILFRCLTGRLPFEGDDVPAMVFRVTLTPSTTLCTYVPDLPEALECEVLRGVEKDPAQRHPSVRAFARALLPFATPGSQERWRLVFGADPPATVASLPHATPAPGEPSAGTIDRAAREVSAPEGSRKPVRRHWSVVVAVIVASAVVGVGVQMVTHRPRPEVSPVGSITPVGPGAAALPPSIAAHAPPPPEPTATVGQMPAPPP